MIVLILCITGLFKSKFKLKHPPKFIFTALIFLLIATISLLLSPLKLTLIQYFISFSYTIRFASFVLLAWLIYSNVIFFTEKNVFFILFSSGITLSILGLLQLFLIPDLSFLQLQGWDPHYFRTVSTFLDPNFAGAYFVLTLVVLIVSKLPIIRFWKIIFFILVYLALMTTFSRSSYLMFVTAFTILALLKKSKTLFILTVILAIGLFWGYINYSKTIAQPHGVDRQQSAQARIDTWEQGLQLFSYHPVLGVGFNTYQYALKQYNLAPESILGSRGSTSNDSSLLFVASTTGSLGFLGFIIFLLSLAQLGFSRYQQKNSLAILILSSLPALLVGSFFSNVLFYPFFLIWIMLVAAITKRSLL